jgi:hypothetical protein
MTPPPGLDLGDSQNGWAFQVTAVKTSAKIKETLEKITPEQRKQYPNVRIVVIRKKQGSYGHCQRKMDFDREYALP